MTELHLHKHLYMQHDLLSIASVLGLGNPGATRNIPFMLFPIQLLTVFNYIDNVIIFKAIANKQHVLF